MMEKNGILKSRKGNAILDSFLVIIMLVVFAMFSFGAFVALNYVNDDIQADATLSNVTKETVSDAAGYYPELFDNAFIVILVLTWCMVLIASFMIDSHPIFFIFSVVLIIFVLIAAGYISNAYQEVMDDAEFISLSSNFPITNFVIEHLIETILAISFSVVLVLFGKNQL